MIYLCILVHTCSVWCCLVYLLFPVYPVCEYCLVLSCPALMSLLNIIIWVYIFICVFLFLPRVCTVTPIKKKQLNLSIRFLLEFSPLLESCSEIYAGPTSCLIVTLLLNVLFLWYNLPSLFIYSRPANIRPVHSNGALSSFYHCKTHPLTADWRVCFGTRYDTVVKSILQKSLGAPLNVEWVISERLAIALVFSGCFNIVLSTFFKATNARESEQMILLIIKSIYILLTYISDSVSMHEMN